MAKEQNLSLNPAKISGTCGRLMCCLKNEQETYEYLNKKLPGNGDIVITPEGDRGEVQSVNVLRQLVKVVVEVNDEKEIREYPADALKLKQRHKKGRDKEKEKEKDLTREERKELELLEKEQSGESGGRREKKEKKHQTRKESEHGGHKASGGRTSG